jgi:D-glycero-alpha-D-manno-heptose-7-phosphate kinase
MIISRTPFRVSFFGGGTDYPVWFEKNGGRVLTSTINKYCHISARYLPQFFEYRNRIVWSRIECVDDVARIEHPAVRAGLQFLDIREGVEIHHDGDLPARTGLGSSSAFTVGMLNALYGLKGVMASKSRLADEAIHIEQVLLREAVGVQDQIQVAHGGLNLIEIGRNGSYVIRPLIIPDARIHELEAHLMLFFTGIARHASKIAETQVRTIPEKERELRRMAEMVDEAVELLTGNGSLDPFGSLLNESWLIKRGLTEKISNGTIDTIYRSAMDAGALGGKLLGAGGGGFMLIFAPPEKQAAVRKALAGLLEIPFAFEFAGTRIIFCDNGPESSGGATGRLGFTNRGLG